MLETKRLVLRPFNDDDIDAFAAMNADPKVMQYFPRAYTRKQTEMMLDAFDEKWNADGYGFAAVVQRDTTQVIGMCGLNLVGGNNPMAGRTEIGWRIASNAWRQGYAAEAAAAWSRYAFGTLNLAEIVAFTPELNVPSRALMTKLGMTEDPDLAFDHPMIEHSSPLRRMVVARLRSF